MVETVTVDSQNVQALWLMPCKIRVKVEIDEIVTRIRFVKLMARRKTRRKNKRDETLVPQQV